MAQDPLNALTTAFTYDPTFNQLASITDPLNHTFTFGHDTKGNLTSITNALNQTTTILPNEAGQPISVTNPLSQTRQFTYNLSNNMGDLLSTIDPLGNTITNFTDAAGRLARVIDALGNTTVYNYDPLDRLTKVTDSLNGVTDFTYDDNGNLFTFKDARMNSTGYTYDNLDRISTRTDPLLNVETYNHYDENGNLTQFTDRNSQVTNYIYDALNRLTDITYADLSTTHYTYDAGNRLIQIDDSLAGTILRTYDGFDRVTSETTPQGSIAYTYDNASRRSTMTVAGQPTITYDYDAANRLKHITQETAVVALQYDDAGRRTALTLPNGVEANYGYDNASRLTSITYKLGQITLGDLTYGFDNIGNRTTIGGSWARTGIPQTTTITNYDNNNRQRAFGDKTLNYDNNGNLYTISDANGTTTFTWNARNQLVGINGPGISASFAYDGLGRRREKSINGSFSEFLFDGGNPVQEKSGTTVMANVLSGLSRDDFVRRTDVATTTTRDLLVDALGSVVALVDSSGIVQTEYTYEPFGRSTVTGEVSSNPFQFTRRENDGTGFYFYRARYYGTELQRFVSEDPLRLAGGDINFYGYVRNNPTDFVDPTGRDRQASSLEATRLFDTTPMAGLQGGAKGDIPNLGGLINLLNETLGFKAGSDFSNEVIMKVYKYYYQTNCDTDVYVCMDKWRPSGSITVIPGVRGRRPDRPAFDVTGATVCVSWPVRGINRCCSN